MAVPLSKGPWPLHSILRPCPGSRHLSVATHSCSPGPHHTQGAGEGCTTAQPAPWPAVTGTMGLQLTAQRCWALRGAWATQQAGQRFPGGALNLRTGAHCG